MTSISSPSSPRNLQFSRLLQSMLLGAAVLGGCADKDPADTGKTTKTSDDGGSSTGGQSSTSATTGAVPVTTSGVTTGDGSGDDTGAGTTAACAFLSCDDMMNVMNECDNWAQDCPEGQKCTAYIAGGGGAWDATKCVDVAKEPDAVGDECTSEGAASGVDSCVKGAMCWSVDDMGVGTCVALCTGSPDAPVCADDVACVIANDGALNLCLPACDPLLQDCLDPNEVCYPINDGFTCAPDASGEEGQANDSCGFINVCDKGLMCADAAFVGGGCEPPATGCCTPFCEFPDGKCPNPDQKCVQYFVEPFPMEPKNSEDIGVCGVPLALSSQGLATTASCSPNRRWPPCLRTSEPAHASPIASSPRTRGTPLSSSSRSTPPNPSIPSASAWATAPSASARTTRSSGSGSAPTRNTIAW